MTHRTARALVATFFGVAVALLFVGLRSLVPSAPFAGFLDPILDPGPTWLMPAAVIWVGAWTGLVGAVLCPSSRVEAAAKGLFGVQLGLAAWVVLKTVGVLIEEGNLRSWFLPIHLALLTAVGSLPLTTLAVVPAGLLWWRIARPGFDWNGSGRRR